MNITTALKTEQYTLTLEKELKSKTEEEYMLQTKLRGIQETLKECDREMLDTEVMCMGIRKTLRKELDDSINKIVEHKCLCRALESESKNSTELMDDIAENKENDMGNEFKNSIVMCSYIDFLKKDKRNVVMDSRLDECISRIRYERKKVLLEMHTLIRRTDQN
jgi:hypothetical protein